MLNKKHILVVNQHGENRGDESAMRAMITGISNKISDVKFTVIVQFQDTSIELDFEQDVDVLHKKMSLFSFFNLVLFSLFRAIFLPIPFFLNDHTNKIIKAYKECDVVVSAPGGPYFGDIYSGHEILHWFYVWLAVVYKKPLFLYAPSAGPFENKMLNPVRKYFYRKFKVLSLREDISRGYLDKLLGGKEEIVVTADSAIQQSIKPLDKQEYFVGDNNIYLNKFIVAISAIEYKFPDCKNPQEKQAQYTSALLQCIEHIADRKNAHFLFIPQLYGKVHSDVPYLEYLVSNLPAHATWEIVDKNYNSDMQRAIFGMSDLCIASRYHPIIFASSSGVPGIGIYYEHKAIGFMRLMGIEEFAFDIRDLNSNLMLEKIDKAIDNREELKELMKGKIVPLKHRSALTPDPLVKPVNAG